MIKILQYDTENYINILYIGNEHILYEMNYHKDHNFDIINGLIYSDVATWEFYYKPIFGRVWRNCCWTKVHKEELYNLTKDINPLFIYNKPVNMEHIEYVYKVYNYYLREQNFNIILNGIETGS